MRALVLVFFSLLLTQTALAQSQICYLVADRTNATGQDRLTSFDRNTNTETDYGSIASTTQIEAIAYNPLEGRLYAANGGTFGYITFDAGNPDPANNPPDFVAVGSGIGSTTNGPLGSGTTVTFSDVDGLMFDPASGALYGTQRRGSNDVLLQINTSTGAFVPNAFDTDNNNVGDSDYVVIGAVQSDLIGGSTVTLNDNDDLAFVYDAGTGTSTLYAIANDGTGRPSADVLITINPETGASMRVNPGSSQLDVGDVEGLTAASDGSLFATTGNSSKDDDGVAVPANNNQFLVLASDGSILSQTTLGSGFSVPLADYEAVACLLDQVGALPVELASFDVTLDGAAALLSWTTASETGNAGFEVQHLGPDAGAAWRVLGFVDGAATTTEARDYRFATEALAPGTHRFRLRQVDFDGASAFSAELEAAVEPRDAAHLSDAYPNPFGTRTVFTLQLQREEQVEVSVYDAAGRRVRTLFQGSLAPDRPHAFELDAASLPSGLYFIRASGERFTTVQRVTLVK